MKTIGLVGGTTWVSTIEYYRAINELVNERRGGVNSAQCLLYSFNFQDIALINQRKDWNTLGQLLLTAAKKLEYAGAECILLCANTMHVAAKAVQNGISVPLLHIGEVTLNETLKRGISHKIGLLGTKFTMELDFIKEKFIAKNINVLIPDENDRDFIHRTIFDELGKNIFTDETKRRYLQIIDSLAQQGAEGVILGCTEIPLLIKQRDIKIPVFDTTLIHATAAVEFALAE